MYSLYENVDSLHYPMFIIFDFVFDFLSFLSYFPLFVTVITISLALCLFFKGAVSRHSAKLGNYKMPVTLREA